MTVGDEVLEKLKEEFRQMLLTEKQALRDRLTAARDRVSEEMTRLNDDLGNSPTATAGGLDERFIQMLEPLLAVPSKLSEQVTALGEQVARLNQELQNREAENSQLLELLLASIDCIESKKSQVDILSSFLEEASHYAPRVALFVSKEDMFSGWRSHGFNSQVFSDLDIKSVHFSFHSETILREAFLTRRAIRGNRLSHSENGVLLERLGMPVVDSIVAIPLVVKEKPTAVLYADGGNQASARIQGEALELFVRVVALSIELLAYRARSVLLQRPTAAETAPYEPVPGRTEAAGQPQEVPARSFEAEVGLGAITTLGAVPPAETLASEQELKLHNDAKRFARLLVSEIKLYNEQKVIAGRQNRDLYDRLKEDIDRSREMYVRRVSPVVAKKVDYFHEELVRTLGENDPGALGNNYPPPAQGAIASE